MKKLEEKANREFKRQVETLDQQTLARLNTARAKALAQESAPARWWPKTRIGWASGLGSAVALASLFAILLVPGVIRSGDQSMLEDIDILSAEADIDLYAQMDFYQWLAQSSLSKTAL